MTDPLQAMPFAQAWEIWSRRKGLAVIAFAMTLAATGSVVAFLPDVYRSTATVLVDRQQVPEEFVRPTVTSALETRLQTISQEILSRSRLEALIARFALYPELRQTAPPEEVILRMRRDIQLDLKSAEARGRGSTTIAFTLSYLGRDPQTVAQVTNTLASFYIEENLKVRERQATSTADFLKVQIDEVKGRLDTQERQVSEFKKHYVGELPQELEVNLATLERLNAQLRLNSDSQTRALERRQALGRQLTDAETAVRALAEAATRAAATPAAGNSSPGVSVGRPAAPAPPPDPAALRLAGLRQELRELRTRFSEKYPDVIRVNAEIAALEQEIAERRTAALAEAEASAKEARVDDARSAPAVPVQVKPSERPVPPTVAIVDPQLLRMRQAVDEVDAEVKILRTEETRLREAIAGYQRRVQDTPVREQQYRELARDYESTKELYASLLKRHAESQIAESMEQRQKGEQFRLLDPAIAAQWPLAPNRPLLAIVALVISGGLAVGVALVAEQRNTSFHTRDALRAFTTAPVLVGIPHIRTAVEKRRVRRRLALIAVSTACGLVAIVGASYVLVHWNEPLVRLLTLGRS